MKTIELPHGQVHYRTAGPENSDRPPVVFVHAFLVDGSVWSPVAARLAGNGIRSYAPDWPLGAHRTPMHRDADQSPRGVAGQVIAFLETLDLRDVTLVGSDTGGALVQYVLDTDASRIGRAVLLNCDAFDTFPPFPFNVVFRLLRSVSSRMKTVDVPALVVWGMADRAFNAALGRRLSAAFNDARLIEIPGARTFVQLDEPKLLADQITIFTDAAHGAVH